MLSPHSGPRWFGIETAEGVVQFGRREDLAPFGGAAPVATLMFNSGSGGPLSGMTFDAAERQAFAGNMGGVGLSVTVPQAAPAGTPPAAPPRAPQPVRVGGNISPPRKLHDVRPAYPDDALKARITGAVILETIIGVDGAVTSVKVLKGHPMLDQAAIDAVRQWRFEPTYLNGVAIPVIMTVITTFNLQ
jgi:TonB family protein